MGGGTREAGWLLSAQAAGGLAGAVVIGAWAKTRPPLSLLGWGAIGLGLHPSGGLQTTSAFVPGVWLGLVLMAADGVPATAFGTGYTAALQAEAADALPGPRLRRARRGRRRCS